MTDDESDGGSLDAVVGTASAARNLLEQVPVPTASLVGPDFVITACNAAYRSMTGRSEIIGLSARDVFPDPTGQLLELLEEAYRTGAQVERSGWPFRYDRGDGLVDSYQDFVIAPMRGRDDEITGLLITTLDVTQRTLARTAAESHARDAQRNRDQALDVVTTLQGALLPRELPVVPGLDVAARYLLATLDRSAGGDWFDAVTRPNGRTALAVGDVVGHGVEASAVMGQLRAVLHERLLAHLPIDEVLASLDTFADRRPEAAAATVCVVEVEPVSGALRYCTAGHPPPLVIGAGGETRYLSPSGAGPLTSGAGFALADDRLAPGEVLVLYTDGLVERPGRHPSESTVELARVMGRAAIDGERYDGAPTRAAERVCQVGLELLTGATGYSDDITVLAAQRVGDRPAFDMVLPATEASARKVRLGLSDWLAELGVRPLDELVVQHAVAELVANCVEHAYGAAAGELHVVAHLDAEGFLVCGVHDQGTWQEPQEGRGRGRGLAMTASLVDGFEVDHGAAGTNARFRHRLSRDAHLLHGRREDDPISLDVRQEYVAEVDGDSVIVRGPLDQTTAELLRPALLSAARGGARPIVVDIGGVTHLGSAAVQLLHELRRQGVQARLLAPPGTVAHHVLELVRLRSDPDAPVGSDDDTA